jgi:hypothetical protein
MKNYILTFVFALISIGAFSQDTTLVQTFTFDSISARRANFIFPQELNSKRFEKVLMYYKLKCDPATPWDSYNCGEWDYLAYTRIFDHTGVYDSVQVDSVRYLNNFNSPPVYNYVNYPTVQDQRVFAESSMSPYVNSLSNIGMTTTGSSNFPFNVTSNGNRMQVLITAGELITAGVIPGDLQSISLNIQSIVGNGYVLHPTISIKGTSLTELTNFEKIGFTEVYHRSRITGSANELAIGQNDFLFHVPYTWNGTDNIIVEFVYEASVVAANDIQFSTESTVGNMAVGYPNRNGVLSLDGTNEAMLELSEYDFGGEMTVSFWSKGAGNNGINTHFMEGIDTLNNRIFNIHFPWSNNNLYFDAGAGSGYDRINKVMTAAEIDNEWHHWAFIKNQATGSMKVMKDGVLWHSGTGFSRPIGEIHRFILGASKALNTNWKGKVDEFQVFNAALSEATVAAWFDKRADAAHPNWSNLVSYYTFDDQEYAEDMSLNDYLLMPSDYGMFDFSEYPVAGVEITDRPIIEFGTGGIVGATTTEYENYFTVKEPEVVFEFATVDNHKEIVNAFVAIPEGNSFTYDENNSIITTTPFAGTTTLTNEIVTHYNAPYELVNDVEIGRFITPYGINFNLTANGSNGFTWIYDVTDYQMYLKDTVDLEAHNTQELLDLQFVFIEGTPPRDVHKREPIWNDWKSYSYKNLDDDVSLSAVSISLSDSSEMFKIKTRITGHGQVGNTSCCEWKNNTHKLLLDGVQRFDWSIYRQTACGDSPNPGQGGTWPYAREGWCPGDLVEEYGHDITPFVTPGQSVQIDYDITPVNAGDPAEGGGNYVMAMDLISYSAPNFQNDVGIVDILNPNNYEYYRKWNPSCSTPRVIIQNTGEQMLTSCVIRISLASGQFIDHSWSGNLNFLQKEIVEIPIPDVYWWQTGGGASEFTAEIRDVQGTDADEYVKNNKKTVKYNIPELIPGQFLVWFNTNNKANENKWRLTDEAGNIIFERTSLTNTTDYKDTFDLDAGCYSLIIEDSDSDGLGYWYSNQVEGETNGSFRVKVVGGSIVETFPRDFGNYHQYNFTVGAYLGVDENKISREVNVYPNPNNGLFYVEMEGDLGGKAYVEVLDLMGRVVKNQEMKSTANYSIATIEMEDAPAGNYFIKIQTNNAVFTKKFIKK